MWNLDTEIRKLPADNLNNLAKLLNEDDWWKKIMAVVKKCDNHNELLFKAEHISMIEQSVKVQNRTAAEIFLSEWGSMGKQRPTCKLLLDLLMKMKFFRAADYLAVDVLRIDRPERPKTKSTAMVDVSDAMLEALLKQQLNDQKRFNEKLIGIAAKEEVANKSDPIKSDLIQFSKTNEILENVPVDKSDLIKFQTEDFVLPEAQSENIPLCVKENMFNSDGAISSVKESSATDMLINSSDTTRTADTEEEIDLPQVSERFIPVVVFESNDDKSES